MNSMSPTHEEVSRIRANYEQWLAEPDHLGTLSLVWRIPRLLARIDHLEALLAERAAGRPT